MRIQLCRNYTLFTSFSADKTLEEGRHWSDDKVLEGRAFFRTSLSPGRLMIDTVKIDDDGIYKCRVDFKIQPTTISHVNFTVNSKECIPFHFITMYFQHRLKNPEYMMILEKK